MKEKVSFIDKILSTKAYRKNDGIVFECDMYKKERFTLLVIMLIPIFIIMIYIISYGVMFMLQFCFIVYIIKKLTPDKNKTLKVFKYYPTVNKVDSALAYFDDGKILIVDEIIWLYEEKIPLKLDDYAKYVNVKEYFTTWLSMKDLSNFNFSAKRNELKSVSERDILVDNIFIMYKKEKIQTILRLEINLHLLL